MVGPWIAQNCTWAIVSSLPRRSDIKLDAYLDNVRISGPSQPVNSTLQELPTACQRMGVVVNPMEVRPPTSPYNFLGEHFIPVLPAPEADVALAPVGRYEPTAADNAFFASRPRTLRSLHRRQFRGWCDAVRGVLGGYTAAPQADRFARSRSVRLSAHPPRPRKSSSSSSSSGSKRAAVVLVVVVVVVLADCCCCTASYVAQCIGRGKLEVSKVCSRRDERLWES